jgi:hypothetical protein
MLFCESGLRKEEPFPPHNTPETEKLLLRNVIQQDVERFFQHRFDMFSREPEDHRIRMRSMMQEVDRLLDQRANEAPLKLGDTTLALRKKLGGAAKKKVIDESGLEQSLAHDKGKFAWEAGSRAHEQKKANQCSPGPDRDRERKRVETAKEALLRFKDGPKVPSAATRPGTQARSKPGASVDPSPRPSPRASSAPTPRPRLGMPVRASAKKPTIIDEGV